MRFFFFLASTHFKSNLGLLDISKSLLAWKLKLHFQIITLNSGFTYDVEKGYYTCFNKEQLQTKKNLLGI